MKANASGTKNDTAFTSTAHHTPTRSDWFLLQCGHQKKLQKDASVMLADLWAFMQSQRCFELNPTASMITWISELPVALHEKSEGSSKYPLQVMSACRAPGCKTQTHSVVIAKNMLKHRNQNIRKPVTHKILHILTLPLWFTVDFKVYEPFKKFPYKLTQVVKVDKESPISKRDQHITLLLIK